MFRKRSNGNNNSANNSSHKILQRFALRVQAQGTGLSTLHTSSHLILAQGCHYISFYRQNLEAIVQLGR